MTAPHVQRPTVLLHACWVSALLLLLAAVTLASVVEVEKVVRSDGEVRARAPGAPIVSSLSGRILHVHVHEGDEVRKGDPLLTIEPDANGLSLQEARINVMRWTASHAAYTGQPLPVGDPADPAFSVQTIIHRGAQSELQAAQAHLIAVAEQLAESLAQVDVEAATLHRQRALEPFVRERLQRHAELVRSGFQSPMSLLTMKQDLVDAEQQAGIAAKRLALAGEAVKRSKAAVRAAQHDLDRLRAQRAAEAYAQMLQAKAALQRLTELSGRSVIVSPVDGVIEHVVRQVAGNAIRSDERLMSVVPESTPMELQLRIRNEDYPFVKAGQAVHVKFEAYPFTIYGSRRAEVVRVLREARGSEAHLSSFVAIAKLHPSPGDVVALDIRPGMAFRADIEVGRQRPIDTWLAPFIRFGHEALRDRR